jgi:hypothetical protein
MYLSHASSKSARKYPRKRIPSICFCCGTTGNGLRRRAKPVSVSGFPFFHSAQGRSFISPSRLTSSDEAMRGHWNRTLPKSSLLSLPLNMSRTSARSLTPLDASAAPTTLETAISYGGTAEQMIANSAPQLRWLLLSPSAMNPPSGREVAVEQPSPPAVQASVPQAASARVGAVALTTSETTAPTAPSPELQQLEADLAAVRQSVEQLAAGQEQMARDIAKLQTAGQDIRRRISALPPAAVTTARKPVPPAQSSPPSSAALFPPAPPRPAPLSSAAPPPPASPEPPSRPPMPVR